METKNCECIRWGGQWEPLSDHHPECPQHDVAAGARKLITALVDGINRWAADEDGVPEELWETYARANVVIGRGWPKKSEPL